MLTPTFPDEKRCSRCGETKHASEFSVVKYKTDAGNRSRKLRSKCKACTLAYDRERYVAHPLTRHPLDAPKYCAGCGKVNAAECFAVRTHRQGKRLASRCKECSKAAIRAIPASRRRGYEKKYKTRTKAKWQQYAAAWYQSNKDRIRVRNKRFRDENPEIVRPRYIAAVYKKRDKGFDRRLKRVREAIASCLAAYRVGDLYWDAYESRLIETPTIDHIEPFALGGGNDADNLCLTSLSANSSKNDDLLIVWLAKRAAQSEA